MELQAFLLSILLLSILTASEGKSLDQSSCAKECFVGTEVGFRSNKEYSYWYSAEIDSSFHTESANDQKAHFEIQANIKIKARSSCDLVLSVEDVISIDGSAPNGQREREWERAVTASPLPFSWQNGKVESLCPTNDEPTWVLNFKRGILSALQVSSMTTAAAVKELDVSGNCEANYNVDEGRYTTDINKIKDYSKCENRERHMLFTYFTPYQSQSPRQNFIHSAQNCRQRLRGTDIESVTCDEEHVFRPFSTEESGARTAIRQRLTLSRQRSLRSVDMRIGDQRRTTLEFEVETEQAIVEQTVARESAIRLVDDICVSMNLEGYDLVGKKFIDLAYTLRNLDTDSLVALYQHLDTCTQHSSSLKEMFVDALPFCGTESCVEYASILIMKEEVKNSVAERWLYGFSFIQNPTSKMVSSLLDVVEAKKLPETSFLTVGTMIHRVCTGSKTNCMNDNKIRTALQVLEQHLGANCHSSNPENYKMILLALRALGNAGRSTSPSTLARCIKEETNEMEIRLSAVQAYRRMPCSEDRSVLLESLYNTKEDSELRINAYVSLMQCPTVELILNIKEILETEPSMQVASFMWSHISETMESDDPLKSFIQTLLAGHTFKEFNLDPRKYSRHHEVSIFSEKLNAGLISESNLIWSPKSFIPRSASVNLTVDLFGQAVNLFEFGGRLQGFEKLLQSYLEPEAYEKRQSRRNDRNNLSPKIKGIQRDFEDKVPRADELKASWFMRVFGNEMLYKNSDMMSAAAREQQSSILADFASQFMSEEGFNYHDDSLLINSRHTLPTGIGMPLQIAFNGSTSVDVHASGNFNFQGLMTTPEYLIRGRVNPRASVLIMGSMTIDSKVKKTGIATESKMVAHSAVDGFARLYNGGNSFEFEVNTPHSKSVNFEFNHKLLTVSDEELSDLATTESYPRTNEATKCSEEFLGQRTCFNYQYVSDRYSNGAPTNAIFPLDGPLEVSLYVEKTDPSLVKYTITGTKKTVFESEEDSIPSELLMQIEFDTPGSRTNRDTSINLSYNLPKKIFFVQASQAGRNYVVQGSYKSNEISKTMTVSANWNGSNYNFEAMFEKNALDGETKWIAAVELETPEKTMNADSSISLNPGKKLQAELTIKNVLPQPIVVKVDLQDKSRRNRDKLSYSGAGEMSVLPWVNTGFSFDMNLKPKLNNLVFDANYKIGNRAQESIMLHHKRSNLGTNLKSDWTIDHSLRLSQFPKINHDIKASFLKSATVTKTDITLAYGADIELPSNRYKVEFNQEFTDMSAGETSQMKGTVAMKVPYLRIVREATIDHLYNKDQLHTRVTTRTTGGPSVFNFMWKNNNPRSPMLDRTIELEFPTPYGHMVLSDTIQETSSNIYESRSELSLGETRENSFSRETTITNLPNEKSIQMSIVKGDGSKVIDMSSINKATGDSVYDSKNMIHVVGSDPLGLNIHHSCSEADGYPTSIEYLRSNVVQLGAEITYNVQGSEKYVTVSLQQNQVEQRTVTMKSGYDFPDSNNFRVYFNIKENSRDIMDSEIAYTKNAAKANAGSLKVKFMEKISESPLDKQTTVTWDIDRTFSTSLMHNSEDRNLHLTFHMNEAKDTVSGVVQHNYCDYVNDASYTISRNDDSITGTLATGRSRAVLVAQKSENELKARFNHNIRDFYTLDVPTRASATLSRSSLDDDLKKVTANVKYGEKSFNYVATFEDKTSRREVLDVSVSHVITNNLFPHIPESHNSVVELTMRSDYATLKCLVNEESMGLEYNNNMPRTASITFKQNFANLKDTVPKNIALAYTKRDFPKQWEIKYVSDRKTVSATALYDSNHIKGEWTNEIIPVIPSKLMYDMTGSFENPWEIAATAAYNDESYTLNTVVSYQTDDSHPLLSWMQTSSTVDVTLNVLRKSDNIFKFSSQHESKPEYFGYTYQFQQSAFETIPSSYVVKEKFTKTSNMVKYFYYREESGEVTSMEPSVTWSDNRYEFTMPTTTSNRKNNMNIVLDVEATSASFTGRHDVQDLVEYVPYSVNGAVNWDQSGDEETGNVQFNWGSDQGLGKASCNKDRTSCEVDISYRDLHYTAGFKVSRNSFSVHETLTYASKVDYSDQIDASWQIGDTTYPTKLVLNANIKSNDKSASTANILELTPRTKTLLVSTKNSQNFCDRLPHNLNFAKNFTWNCSKLAFEVTIGDEDGQINYVKANMLRDGTNSVEFTMDHNIESWTDTVAQHLVLEAKRMSTDSDHKVEFSITEDRVKRSVTGLVSYQKTDEMLHLNATASHDFETLVSEFGIPKKMSAQLEGTKNDDQCKISLDMIYGEKFIMSMARRVRSTETSAAYESSIKQNVSPDFPANIRTDTEYRITNTGGSVSVTNVVDGQNYDGSLTLSKTDPESVLSATWNTPDSEAASAELKWSSGLGSVSYNMPSLENYPKSLKLMLQPNADMSGATVDVQTNEYSRRMRMQRGTSEGVIEFSLSHDFAWLNEYNVPNDIEFKLVTSPSPSVRVTFDDKIFSIAKGESKVTVEQNMFDDLPKSIEFICNCDMKSQTKVIDLQCNVDNSPYQVYMLYDLNMNENVQGSVRLEGKLIMDENQLTMYTNINSRDTRKSLDFAATQSVSDDVPPKVTFNTVLTKTRQGGSIQITASKSEDPVTVRIQYTKVADMHYTASVNHNQYSISETIPTNFDVDASFSGSKTKGTFDCTIQAGSATKPLTVSFKNMNDNGLDFSFTVNHDFDILESELLLPKYLEFSLSGTALDASASVEYDHDSERKSVSVHYDYEDSQFHASIDQNIFKEWIPSTGRRNAVDFPKKISFTIGRNDDGGFIYKMTTKAGKRRRYFIVEYQHEEVSNNNTWKFDMSQNMNKMLPFEMPTSIKTSLTLAPSAIDVSFGYNSNKYEFGSWRDDHTAIGFNLAHTDNSWSRQGVPNSISWMGRRNKVENSFYTKLVYDEVVSTLELGLIDLESSKGMNVQFTTNAVEEPISITATIKGMKDNGEYVISVSGSQAGLNEYLPTNYQGLVGAKYVSEGHKLTLRSLHNIPVLKEKEIPYQTEFSTGYTVDLAQKTFTGMIKVDMDSTVYSSHTISAKKLDNRVTFEGERTKGIWATNEEQQLNYRGSISDRSDENGMNWQYRLSDYNSRGSLVRQDVISIESEVSEGSVTWDHVFQVEVLNEMGWPKKCKGSVTYDESNFHVSNELTLKDDSVVTVTINKNGNRNFNFNAQRNDEFMRMGYTHSDGYQFTFKHNMEYVITKYIPSDIQATFTDERNYMKIDSEFLNFVASSTANQFDLTVKVTKTGSLLVCSAEYNNNRFTGSVQIPPAEIDYSVTFQKRRFSFTSSLTNNNDRKSLIMSGQFYVGDSLDIRLSATSTIPSIPLNYEFIFANSETDHKVSARVGKYSAEVDISEREYKIAGTLPESFAYHQFALTGSCTTENDITTSDLSLQWNNKQPVHLVVKSKVLETSHDISVDITHPIREVGWNTAYGHYTMEKRNSEYNIRYVGRLEGNSITVDATYTPEKNGPLSTHAVTVNIQHTMDFEYIPRQFVTTGVITYGDYYYDSRWKLTSDEFEPIILNKQFKCTGNTCTSNLLWKQPFRKFPYQMVSADMQYVRTDTEITITGNYNENGSGIKRTRLVLGKQYNEKPLLVSASFRLNQPFESLGFSSMSGEFSLKETNGQYRTLITGSKDEKSTVIDATYTPSSRRGKTTHSITVDIRHPHEISLGTASLPKHFVTTGVITYGSKLYDSKWKITSDEMDPLIFEKQYKGSDEDYHMHVLFKQPVEAFPLSYLSSTADLHLSENIKFTADWQHNDESKIQTGYTMVPSDNGKARNETAFFSLGEDKYTVDSYYSFKGRESTGYKFVMSYNTYFPEKLTFMGQEIPSEHHFDETIFWRNNNLHFQSRVNNNLMEQPMNFDFLYVLNNGNQLFDSTLKVRKGDDESTADDLFTSVNIHKVEGATVTVRMPKLEVDKSVNVKYTKQGNVITITVTEPGQEPEVININLGQIIPKFKSLLTSLKSSRMWPQIKFVKGVNRENDMNDCYAGLQIENTPYTVHLVHGVAVQKMYITIATKENFVQKDEILRVDGSLTTPNNVQLQIKANKKISAFVRIIMTSCNSELKKTVTAFGDLIRDFLESSKRVVDGSQRVEMTVNDNVEEWINFVNVVEKKLHEIVDNVDTSIYNSVISKDRSVEMTVRKAIEIVSRIVEQIKRVINKPLEEFKKDYLEVISSQIFQVVTPILNPVTLLLNKVRAGQLFLELAQEGITKFVYFLEKNSIAVLNAAQSPIAELVYINDNEVVINIPLAFSVDELVSPPSFGEIKEWIAQSSLAHEVKEKLEILFKAKDYYYQYRSVLNMPIDELVPPFKGHAEITGFKHFRTFDGKRYDFASDCSSSHVLAHDFRNKEFTVLLNYGDRPSITVTSTASNGRQNTVVLNRDYSVTDESGRSTPLPLEYGDMTVTRTGVIVTAKTDLGLTVACNFESELCTIDVSPFYFASIGGMAGSFNYEPNDDFVGPQVEAETSEVLAKSWMTPGDCRARNTISECTRPTNKVCTDLFEDSKSMLYSCFPVVDPAPYLKMCAQDTCRRSSESNTCGAVSSYARVCKLHGVDLPMPDSCVRCDLASGSSFSNSQEVTVSAADVVFVIEKSGCMRIKKKDYKRLLNNLHSEINDTAASGNLKYAVVGFGGPRELSEPHTITLRDDIFMQVGRDLSQSNEREIISALKRGERTSEDSDVLEALYYAAQLPFRAGASRTIILLTCDDCTKPSTVKINSVKTLLRQQGVVVHHLRQKNIQSGSKKVYGYNQNQVFAKSSGDSPSRSSLKISGQDQCVPLVDVTSGSAWSASMINRESVNYIVAEIISGVNAVPRQSCMCTVTSNNSPTAKCSAA